MNVLLAILVLAALFAVVWITQSIGRAGVRAANRALFHSEFAEAQSLIKPASWTVACTSAEALSAIRTRVNAAKAPTGAVVLYENAAADDEVVFIFGSKVLGTQFATRVSVEPNGLATRVTTEVVSWTEEAGLPTHQAQIRHLRQQIEAAIRTTDPAAEPLT